MWNLSSFLGRFDWLNYSPSFNTWFTLLVIVHFCRVWNIGPFFLYPWINHREVYSCGQYWVCHNGSLIAVNCLVENTLTVARKGTSNWHFPVCCLCSTFTIFFKFPTTHICQLLFCLKIKGSARVWWHTQLKWTTGFVPVYALTRRTSERYRTDFSMQGTKETGA